MGPSYLKIKGFIIACTLLLPSCSTPLIETTPGTLTDTSSVTILCNASEGNQGLLDFTGPVYVHMGLITDSSLHSNEWRYVKFQWGSTEDSALATPAGKNKWSYTIPNIRKFFGVDKTEKIIKLGLLFREGNCIDTFCKVLRNADKTDMFIPISQ